MSSSLSKPLSEKEIDKLSDFLSSFVHKKAMGLEEVDGFFAALHCSPTIISLNDFLSDVWGDETGEEEAPFGDIEEFNQFLSLLMRYWNDVGCRFQAEVFFPNLVVDEKTDQAKGNDWAKGFLRGVHIAGSFGEMIENEEEGGSFLPVFALAHEQDDDPELRSFKEEISSEQREELLIFLCVSVTRIYRYFLPYRKAYAKLDNKKIQ